MAKLFGTDGVRGVANRELTGELAYKLGRAAGYYLTRHYKGNDKATMLIGKDTRVSGDMLESALTAGMASAGIDVLRLGIIPTPGVAYLTAELAVEGAVMISASHNPIADNGIKFFDKNGYKLSDQMEEEIEALIKYHYDTIPSPTSLEIGNSNDNYELTDKYIDYLISTVDVDFTGLKIALDCANGAAYRVAPEVLQRLGAEIVVSNNHPAGDKINLDCGSTHPELIKELVVRENADLGIAHDGDADRIVMIDNNGEVVDGDKIMAVWAADLLQRGELKKKTLVTTAYSNLGLKEAVEGAGGKVVITDNGDRYVLKEMLENNYNLGGEKSGHIIYLDYNRTGDGVLTAVQIVEIVKRRSRTLNELSNLMEPWPQRLANVEVKYKEQWENNDSIRREISKAEQALSENGRVFVRASGTEPVVRIMLEGKNEGLLIELEEKLIEVIKSELN